MIVSCILLAVKVHVLIELSSLQEKPFSETHIKSFNSINASCHHIETSIDWFLYHGNLAFIELMP